MSQEEEPHGAPPAAEHADAQGRLDAAREELQELHRRMDAIKQEVADEVDRRWESTARNPQMFDVKVSARLSAHEEYQSLMGRVRETEQVEASLAAELEGTTEDESG
ncbi:MAG: hypothetical protein M3O70_09330 [Actinomycetota bacterium]|nr:hypothetical protein [Actinomycetota bacterium]